MYNVLIQGVFVFLFFSLNVFNLQYLALRDTKTHYVKGFSVVNTRFVGVILI